MTYSILAAAVATSISIVSLAQSPAAQSPAAKAQATKFADVEVVGHVVEPVQLPPAADDLSALQVPAGFRVSVFARDLGNPRILAVHEGGDVYVTRRKHGDVMLLRDTDGDGAADQRRTVAKRPGLHGIAIAGDTMYLTTVNDLYRARISADGSLGPLERLIDDLPDGGQHPNRMVVVGPDRQLYLTAGSTCNACDETNPESATLLRIAPDGSSRSIYASGLRNTIGYGFHPASGHLYGMDHGIDWLGDNEQHEELNRIVEGATYGWPYVYADGQPNPADYPPGNITMADWIARSAPAIGLYTPHAAPMQLAYYTAEAFPPAYRNDAFIAMRGSWNRSPPSGYEIVRIRFSDAGEPEGFEPFVQGFVTDAGNGSWGHRGRLCGLAQTRDGALLFTDDTNGVIYRIGYEGTAGTAGITRLGSPTNDAGTHIGLTGLPAPTPPATTPPQLAMAILTPGTPPAGARAAAKLKVTSSAFGAGATIPKTYGAEGENISPPLSWSAGPSGTRGYVVLMEDPAVGEQPPFVHWMLYGLATDVTSLPEAVPVGAAVPEPGGLQGRNDRGTMGYFGPRPPRADPAHPYHFQVFAVDTVLQLPFGASRAEVLEAMRGHVLASGELVGRFER